MSTADTMRYQRNSGTHCIHDTSVVVLGPMSAWPCCLPKAPGASHSVLSQGPDLAEELGLTQSLVH